MRLRRSLLSATAALGGILLVAACGSSNTSDQTGGAPTVTVTHIKTVTRPETSSTASGPQTDTAATKTSTTPEAVGNACTASDLTASYLGSNGAAGTIVLGFALKNTGASTCHTYGWPGVQFLSASGRPLPTNPKRTTGDVVGSTPAGVLTLKPGQEASFRVVTSDMGPGGSGCPSASSMQIYAPDDTSTMRVPLPGIAACGSATVSPMLPGDSAFAGMGGGGGQGSGGGGTSGLGGSGNGGSGV